MSRGGHALGTHVGTFEGRAGDQFSEAAGMVDVYVTDAGSDPETGEDLVSVRLRMEKAVDEDHIRVTLPEHGVKRLVDELESGTDS